MSQFALVWRNDFLKNKRVPIKANLLAGALAVAASFSLALTIYILIIQTSLVRKRELFLTLLIFLALIIPLYLFFERILFPKFQSFSRRGKILLLGTSFLVGLFVSFTAYRPPIFVLFPEHSLVISVPESDNQDSGHRMIALLWFSRGSEDISFSQFEQEGSWIREPGRIFLEGPSAGTLRWVGRVDPRATLQFEISPQAGLIRVDWDGVSSAVDLSGENGTKEIFLSEFANDNRWSFIEILIYFISSFLLFLSTTVIFLRIQIKEYSPSRRKKYAWLLYSLPMVLFWGVFLFFIYPGYVPEDPMVQWQQILVGTFTDHHPVLYGLFMILASRIYPFPASVVILQILLVSLVVAWGLGMLDEMGVSRKITWGIAILFAILPINNLSVVALLKDVPYSTAVLALSVIFLKVVRTRGSWLGSGWHWLLLGLVLGAITLFRINGLPVALGSLAILTIFYRRAWKKLLAALAAFTVLVALMYGPVYVLLKVTHEPEFGSQLFLHHIAAHIKAETPLTPEQETYLGKLAPIEDWKYDCCLANPTVFAIFPNAEHVQDFSLPLLRQDIKKPARIALDLFLKDPAVDLRHMVCQSQIVWSINSSCPDRENVGIYTLLIEKNISLSGGFQRKLVALAKYYFPFMTASFNHNLNWIMALYLYCAIFCTAILSIRASNWRLLLFLSPIVIQSLTLMLINISQTYRYQYGVALVGILSIGMLFVPLKFIYRVDKS